MFFICQHIWFIFLKYTYSLIIYFWRKSRVWFYDPTYLKDTSSQADAIISRLKIEDYKEANAEPTLLITSDIVCLTS